MRLIIQFLIVFSLLAFLEVLVGVFFLKGLEHYYEPLSANFKLAIGVFVFPALFLYGTGGMLFIYAKCAALIKLKEEKVDYKANVILTALILFGALINALLTGFHITHEFSLVAHVQFGLLLCLLIALISNR